MGLKPLKTPNWPWPEGHGNGYITLIFNIKLPAVFGFIGCRF